MRIGWISQMMPYLPARDGFRLYGANLIRELHTSHDIDLVSLVTDEDRRQLAWALRYCRTVLEIKPSASSLAQRIGNAASSYLFGRPRIGRREALEAIKQLARKWDLIHVEGALAGGWIPPVLSIPKVISLHDSEVLRSQELLKCARTTTERFRLSVKLL